MIKCPQKLYGKTERSGKRGSIEENTYKLYCSFSRNTIGLKSISIYQKYYHIIYKLPSSISSHLRPDSAKDNRHLTKNPTSKPTSDNASNTNSGSNLNGLTSNRAPSTEHNNSTSKNNYPLNGCATSTVPLSTKEKKADSKHSSPSIEKQK